jgi:hypothetical protein
MVMTRLGRTAARVQPRGRLTASVFPPSPTKGQRCFWDGGQTIPFCRSCAFSAPSTLEQQRRAEPILSMLHVYASPPSTGRPTAGCVFAPHTARLVVLSGFA